MITFPATIQGPFPYEPPAILGDDDAVRVPGPLIGQQSSDVPSRTCERITPRGDDPEGGVGLPRTSVNVDSSTLTICNPHGIVFLYATHES